MLGKMAQDADVKEGVKFDEDMLDLSWLMLRVVREFLGNLSARNHLNTNERMLCMDGEETGQREKRPYLGAGGRNALSPSSGQLMTGG